MVYIPPMVYRLDIVNAPTLSSAFRRKLAGIVKLEWLLTGGSVHVLLTPQSRQVTSQMTL